MYYGRIDFGFFEMGYVFNKQYCGQGYVKESCMALIEKAFSEGTHRIFVECNSCYVNSLMETA